MPVFRCRLYPRTQALARFRVAKHINSNVPEPNLLFQFVTHTHTRARVAAVAAFLKKVKQMPDGDFG